MSNVPAAQAGFVDLRSDTVSRPTPAMYEAMCSAPLGDDVLGDEPTVAELEALAAEMLGKEAAVFVPSGTMGNQIALASHCERGDAILIEEEAHILFYECAAPAIIGNVVTWTLPSEMGIMDPDNVERHVVKRSLHSPGTTLLCLENTHNRAGGTIIPLELMRAYSEIAERNGLRVHLDGARIFNASVGLGVDVREIARHVDSVSFCLSKGLGSPVGSLLCGSGSFIEKAREWRKRLGGGMRQSGILAACGVVSLQTMVDRLADDHRRARQLAEAIDQIPGMSVDWQRVQTNMVLVYTEAPAQSVIEALRQNQVLALSPGSNRIRCVFHHDITDEKLARACEGFRCAARAAV
jgi:threonine aldolase